MVRGARCLKCQPGRGEQQFDVRRVDLDGGDEVGKGSIRCDSQYSFIFFFLFIFYLNFSLFLNPLFLLERFWAGGEGCGKDGSRWRKW